MYQAEKAVVLGLYEALAADQNGEALRSATAEGYVWRGFHPFNLLQGADTVTERFWQPLTSALRHVQRRQDIFFAGANALAEGGGPEDVWVVSMGHLMGLFDAPWLGIRPTGKMAFLR